MSTEATQTRSAALKEELATILARHEKELEDFGEKVAREAVEPVCRKYRLRFSSGMGTFFFYRKDKEGAYVRGVTFGDEKDVSLYGKGVLSEKAQNALRPVLDLLNEEIHHGHYVGFLFEDVE